MQLAATAAIDRSPSNSGESVAAQQQAYLAVDNGCHGNAGMLGDCECCGTAKVCRNCGEGTAGIVKKYGNSAAMFDKCTTGYKRGARWGKTNEGRMRGDKWLR